MHVLAAPYHIAERTLEGVEALHIMRKGQVRTLPWETCRWFVRPGENLSGRTRDFGRAPA
jgi:hypothetical protein